MNERIRAIAVGAAMAMLFPVAAGAAVYPVNACVGTKMLQAGKYCSRVLMAWSAWDKTQDTAKRDLKLAAASTKLLGKWSNAEIKSFGKGVICSDTTASSTDMQAAIDAAIASVITAVNTGLNLSDKAQAKCGAAVLKAAAKKCAALLKIESKFIQHLEKDPLSALRNQKKTLVSQKFTNAWTKATSGTCPTSATETGTEAAVDALRDDVVRDTTVSPNVSDTSFDIIPAGPLTYEKRFYQPQCGRATSYSFFVKRGSVNKLLMYYQGGGACWDYFTCKVVGTYDQSVDIMGGDNPNLGSHSGLDDQSNPANPFKDWSVVFVPYCSGDVHLGDAEATYVDGSNSVTIQHRGFANAKVAEKFAREHFVNPDQIFITGSSAGAYGALLHAAWLHRVYPASDISVLGDAGNGVITEDFRMNHFPAWGVNQNLPPNVPGLTDLTVPETTVLAATTFPRTRWAHYTSAYDGGTGGQTGFYNIMLNPDDIGLWLNWWSASCAWNSIMRAQAQATFAATATPDNYRYYIGTGSRHTMFGSSKVYTDTTGGVPTIVDWINAMLNNTPDWVNVEATNSGLLLPGDPQPSPLQAPFALDPPGIGPDVKITCP